MDANSYYLNVIQPIISKNAVTASAWEQRGNVFDPEMQIIIGTDFDSQEAARLTIERFGSMVMAAHVEAGPWVSIELVFSPLANNPVGFYNGLPEKLPRVIGVFRNAEERVSQDFNGYILVPHSAKSWAEVTPISRTTAFKLKELQAFVGGNIEVYGASFRGRRSDIYCNEIGRILNLPINPLATAFVANYRPNLNCMLVGDVLLTFGNCCERRNARPDITSLFDIGA